MAYHLLALFFAAFLPAMLFVSQAVVRRQRSAVYLDIVRNLFPDDHLPQLDLVGAKYGAPGRDASGVERPVRRQPSALIGAAFLYGLLAFVGFEILLVPIAALISAEPVAPPPWTLAITPSFFWASAGKDAAALSNTVAVVAMAFLGGYIGAARYLVRQALNYELDGMSFMRSSLQLVMGMIVAMVAFRTLTNGGDFLRQAFDLQPAAADNPPGWWLGVGFLLGLSPETGLAWLSRRMRFAMEKSVNPNVFEKVEIVPVEIVDGIDTQIAYRLDQNNIEDIQNLATANPIQLYIETPYGLFEVFDWVLQAQLCLVTGPTVFLELKRHGVRTIFDLERAVLAEGVPPAYVQALGEILFAGGQSKFRERLGGADTAVPVEIVEHAVALTMDDLHVHRLRALWLQIHRRSWNVEPCRPPWLYRGKSLPGDVLFECSRKPCGKLAA